MKKQSSTSQFLTVREKCSSTVVAPTFESARGTRKRKLTDKSEPAGLSSISIKQPLGPSTINNIAATLPVKSKVCDSQVAYPGKRAKENFVPTAKKTSLSSVCRDSKALLRAHLDVRNDRYSANRSNKTPARKEYLSHSSRMMEHSMIEVRHTEYHPRDLQMIMESSRQQGYSMHLHTIMSESKPDPDEDFEPLARDIIEDIVDGMFKGNELRLRGLERENRLLKEELLKIKDCFQNVQQEQTRKIELMASQLKQAESQSEELRATKNKHECMIAELEYRLAEAHEELEGRDRGQLSELEMTVQSKETELANVLCKLDVCERQSETFKRELVTTKKENVVLRKENCHYRTVLEENESKLNESSTTITQLHANIDSSRRMIHSLEAQLRESQSQLKVPESELVSGLKEMVTHSSSEIFRLNREMSSMEIKLAIIERRHMEELQRLKGVHNKELRMWRERNKKLVKCNSTLKRMIEEKEDISIDFSLNDQKE